jgi:hypothetical protein
MSRHFSFATSVRRVLVRRPWLYWLLVVAIAFAISASVLEHVDRVDTARDRWGDSTAVYVAARTLAPGDTLEVVERTVPVAVVPDDAIGVTADPRPLVVRQHVMVGEIVTNADVAASTGALALVPAGWAAVPIVESPASGASIGDRVQLASGGVLVADRAVVVGVHDDVTLVAVPADVAPMIPAAATTDGIAVLLVP